jgi:hypothetical protein
MRYIPDLPLLVARVPMGIIQNDLTSRQPDGRRLGLCCYLVAVNFPLAMCLNNLCEEPSSFHVAITFIAPLLLVALADLAARRMVSDIALRSLLLVIVVLFFLGYGHAHHLVFQQTRIQHRYFLPLWLGATGSLAFLFVILRRKPLLGHIAKLTLTTSAALIVVQLVAAAPVLCSREAWPVALEGALRPTSPSSTVSAEPGDPTRPDIYYIILDGYARADVLREVYGYDNQSFLDALAGRGFYVASRARSNYSQTRLSLPSSLSLDYLPSIPPQASYDVHHQRLRVLRKKSRVVARLRQLGYRYRYVGSMYHPVDAAADEELFPSGGDGSYLRAFISTTILELAHGGLRLFDHFPDPVEVNEYQFSHIGQPKSDLGPLYTFAHVACPHAPFVYDRHGPLAEAVDEEDAEADHYVEQLQYLNDRVLELIDRIDRTSGPDSVVLLQADHGSSLLGMPQDPSRAQLFERMSILSAYRVPESVRRNLYPTVTPVNSFRLLFAGLFGDDLPVLDDRSLYSAYDAPFRFVECPEQPPSTGTIQAALLKAGSRTR